MYGVQVHNHIRRLHREHQPLVQPRHHAFHSIWNIQDHKHDDHSHNHVQENRHGVQDHILHRNGKELQHQLQ